MGILFRKSQGYSDLMLLSDIWSDPYSAFQKKNGAIDYNIDMELN